MSRSSYYRRQPPPRDERYWQQIVENRLPLVGGWFREVAINRLAQSARQGIPSAAQSLAVALDSNPDETVQEISRQTLQEIEGTASWNAVWSVWAARRPPLLAELLLERGRPATAPFSLRLLSLLLLDRAEKAEPIEAGELPELLRACQDRDRLIAGRAQSMLTGLTDPETIDAFCSAWLNQRQPYMEKALLGADYIPGQVLLRVMVALRRGETDEILSGGAEVVPPLLRAGIDRDPRIKELAVACLARLNDLDARDELCRIWSQDRNTLAEKVLMETGWIARQPPRARYFSAFKAGRADIAARAEPDDLPVLLEAAADSDPFIKAQSLLSLGSLMDIASQQALCLLVIADSNPVAAEIAVQAGYSPAALEQQALFAFLTGQWEAYLGIDFDQRILQSVYSAGDTQMRQRISQAVQSSGRTDLLSILTGGAARPEAASFAREEAELYTRLLVDSQQWNRVWDFAQGLPVDQLLQLVTQLSSSGWQACDEDAPFFASLQRLAIDLMQPNSGSSEPIPPAVRAATIRVRGRVNALAFAPDRPILAIGTGQRVVVLFDYAQGVVLRQFSGFQHSISRVAFSPSGRLFCAERTNPEGECGLYELQDEPRLIGRAAGSILALRAAPEERLLTLSRDRQLTIWDSTAAQPVRSLLLPVAAGLPRELLLSPPQNRLALLYRHVSFLNYPQLDGYSEFYRTFNRSTHLSKSAARSGVWLEESDRLVVGQHNGQVVEYRTATGKSYREKRSLYQHDRTAVAVEWLPESQTLLSAGAEGDICFYPAPDWQPVQTISCPCQSLTTMLTSPGEQLMAVGTSDNRLQLWDLRARDLAQLLERPLGSLCLPDLALARSLLAADDLPSHSRQQLEGLQAALAHRFRYDIQLEPQPLIRPGEYDILLAEAANESG